MWVCNSICGYRSLLLTRAKNHALGCHTHFFLFVSIDLFKSPYCLSFPISANFPFVARSRKKQRFPHQDLSPRPWNPPPLDKPAESLPLRPTQILSLSPLPPFKIYCGQCLSQNAMMTRSLTFAIFLFLAEVDDVCCVHHSRLKDDMMSLFKNEDSLDRISSFRIIDEREKLEEGEGSDVTRDVIATFWQQLLAATMVGDREKVPCIRHDFHKSEWSAIGRVLVFGFKEVNYFPISLCKAFLVSCLFGEESIDGEFLLSSFRFYITSEERETFDNIRKGACESDDDDVLEFLGNYLYHPHQRKH